MSEPMRGPSTPSDKVKGPQDLVALMNTATSEDWEMVPLPARQQLGYHERLHPNMSINDYTGKEPEELVGSLENSVPTDSTAQLSSFVDYHLEATAPPAEPAGAPGSAGYNQLTRNVPPAKGFELDVEHDLTQTTGGRVIQFAPGQDLSPEEQAKVDGAGPHIPSPITSVAGSGDQGEKYGTANGVLHGQPEGWDGKTSKDAAEVSQEQVESDKTAVGGSAGGSDAAEGTSSPVAPPAAAPAAGQDGGNVPHGSIDKVLAWVGDDKGKAQAALDAEQGKDEPRQSLITRLNERLNG